MQIQQKSPGTYVIKNTGASVVVNPVKTIQEDVVLFTNPDSETEGEHVMKSAGEFEAKDIFVYGKKAIGQETVLYAVHLENITTGIITGIHAKKAVPDDFFDDAQIIILQVGDGTDAIAPKEAYELLQKLSPNVAIIYTSDSKTLEDIKALATINPLEKNWKATEEELGRIETTEFYYFA